ncbi:unnamed protein product [Rhizoctonia solani]|uniref:Protein kinase domain-containing protein n=1 Tax=Rhizoctonia solani TaxID=456999 RepID=A0A8H3D0M5_9AGAM|nr:unnamed protein product [Rhizoctonia solani]
MDTNQPRPGILSSFASSFMNAIQPLVAGHQGIPQPDRETQEQDLAVISSGSGAPSRLIPGRWDSVDYNDVAMADCEVIEARQVPTEAHVTTTESQADSIPEPLRTIVEYGNGDPVNHNVTIVFPEPHILPPAEVAVKPHLSAQLPPGPNPAALVAEPPSRSQSHLPSVTEQVFVRDFGKTSESKQPESTQTASLKTPVFSGSNRSQEHLPISPTSPPPAHSSGSKVKNFIGSLRPHSPNPPTGRSRSPSAIPTGRLRTFEQDTTLDVSDSKIEYFQNVELHSSTSWEVICNELVPLPALGSVLSQLQRVFGAVDSIRTYRGQWRRLRGNCVVTSRMLAHQLERYQTEPERLKLLGRVCHELENVITDISETAQKWSKKNAVEAFVRYESMDTALKGHFQALGDVLKMMVSTSQVLNETWTSEIAKSQREEREQLEMIHALLEQHNSSLAQLAQAIQSKDELIARLIGENETTIGRFLGQQITQFQQARGDAEDTDKLIQLIVQITGVEIPTEVFQTEPCTNVSGVEPIHGHSSTVYQAKLALGQLVAKKVFYLNKYSEGDVKTYAMKMTRDAKLWRVFDSEYTLKCLGIGMERSNDTQFKLYMLSPWMGNMDTLKYLKDRRDRIGQRNILRIVGDAALGLVEIHRKSSVHSNMRAQNVFVRANGRGILGGFGLTKALKNHATGKLPSVEQTGQSLPYRWMAPECHNFGPGRPDVTVANDVWGWAMTALEIITGAPPIRRISGDMILPLAKVEEFNAAKQRHEYPEWEKYAHKPDLLWSLLSRCWDLDPTKRPNMQTVSDELEKIIAQS